MRTVRLVGHQAPAVERSACANAIGQCGGGLDHQRSAHAVALGADLLRLVDLLLPVQEGDVRDGILLRRARRVHRRHQWLQLRHVSLILEVEGGGVVEHGRLG